MKTLRTTLALLLLAGALLAQKATFTGTIEPVSLKSFCQEETHVLTCTGPTPLAPSGVLLKSGTLDLDAFVGVNARFTATLRGVECPIWDVTAAQVPPPATLVSCGAPTPGCPLRFRVGPSGVLGQWLLFASVAPDFAPVNKTFGTWLIAPPRQLVATGLTAGETETLDIVVPGGLSGISVWMQGVRRDIGPIGPYMSTNAVCFTITGPSPPCFATDC